MRLLVACSKCGRQYDASEQAVGSQFRCRCGEAVVVHQPEGHDAAVVRCSSCGAPRQDQSPNCEFCGAGFTLHELDQNTICPHCMTRVSDRAKFCHCCGMALAPEPVAALETELPCPACGGKQNLHSRHLGDINVMECERCAGLWLSTQTFEHLSDLANSDSLRNGLQTGPLETAATIHDVPDSGGPRYRRCPVCGGFMNRCNYASKSGVILDVCKKDGAWFDGDELARILAWIRAGGLLKANQERAQQAQETMAHAERQRGIQAAAPRAAGFLDSQPAYWEGGGLFGLLERLFMR